ncbi:MAG: hypothetical protein A3B91_00470 [Candidatus Yanofskybacteria bacterium RIFCSPHIGHO2_02_FULL_41_29]|uniref:Uncharacterized protein n=1 Tax=Candidatus Yanofskybacteria bacterium RIFCSPHIGHO2_01_FULL_41_53 TaxID=1802663 RepID=A0A1F8EH36_9BACT|nr:MAG: hypothetical protein A2650_05095 [Candidatus Yanofskybacteria bacterium RIFCSPHIGHO2_01_FULL_41_53]OGN10454.1 MAG: hypothetical protein A3B91_00470 [Candidatus Yanofskybacteria bacterium RIFCSPHIGHO2_02_FULL_41_29]OGN17987.1 MAG: hypothetical protein A3F48_04795 [Candidatus Yanofskybacteria bacterium RIFCSPHIGHO2_12_FULL_41_9]OGN21402.1 MAG: hypothetical protein A2916_00030 [Candidatus Yanofskybacteria bacterium RIFCSPLOWO2_01_FULL_41_67]OGN29247.1 MAG: hypothetical protein A3H54_03685 
MKKEQLQESERQNLAEYLEKNSNVVIDKDKLNEEIIRIAMSMKGMLGYYDSRDVKFSVDGYDFVYFNNEGDLLHVKIKPEEVLDLEKAGKIHESDELEEKLKELGFELDQSEKFRSALWRQLNPPK